MLCICDLQMHKHIGPGIYISVRSLPQLIRSKHKDPPFPTLCDLHLFRFTVTFALQLVKLILGEAAFPKCKVKLNYYIPYLRLCLGALPYM
jgi:hypothetical protein